VLHKINLQSYRLSALGHLGSTELQNVIDPDNGGNYGKLSGGTKLIILLMSIAYNDIVSGPLGHDYLG